MSQTERNAADKLLAELAARAGRADAAEAELAALKRRLYQFHYEKQFRPEESSDPEIVGAIERSIGAQIGQAILEWTNGNPHMKRGYGAKRQETGNLRRRYTVTVMLEEKSDIEPQLFTVED